MGGMAPRLIFPPYEEEFKSVAVLTATAWLARCAAGTRARRRRWGFVLSGQGGVDLLHGSVSDGLRYGNGGADLIGCRPRLMRFREVQDKIRHRLNAYGRGDGSEFSENPEMRSERRFKFRPGALTTFAPAVHAAGCGAPHPKGGLNCELNPAITGPSFPRRSDLKLGAGLAARGDRCPERD